MVSNKTIVSARYFLVIGLHPVYALVALVVIVTVGMVTLWLDPAELDSGLGMILFAQMFLASTGFVMRARQGHFDPLLTGRWRRGSVVASHWAVSTAPGVVSWLVVVGAAWLTGSAAALSAIAGRRAAALVIVSAIAWTLGFALPRGAAGMLWMALLMVLVTQRAELLAASTGAESFATIVWQASIIIACPFLLLSNRPAVPASAIGIALGLSLMLLAYVMQRSRTLDICLVDRS